jgi:putative tricarboxylic transport membrane protein
MQKNLRAARTIGLAAAMVAASMSAGHAQGWQPTEEVEIVTHVGTTSSTWTNADMIARVINELKLFPHGVTVTIMDGARGAKARTYVGKTNAGNPHKLQMLVPTQIANPILARSEIDRSLFRGVAFLLITPKAITVNADSPYNTLDDLIEAARKNPAKVIHGGGDLGSTSSMVSRIMEEYFDIDVTYTPFDDQGVIQLLGGHIDYIFAQPELVGKFVKSGRMRMLASSQKLGEFPDVPTLAELGHTFEVLDSYRGLWTSKDVPDEAVAFYVDALEKVVASEQFKEYMVQNSMAPHWVTGDDLDKALEREIEVFTKVATEMNLIEK